MARCYPLNVVDHRTLPDGFDGDVFIWDIDKTYLATRFSSPKYMARIPLEFAVDKKAIPGMPELLRGIRRGPGPTFGSAPLYFVSASPPQLRRVIERKMLIDGVDYDGITFKDWGATLRQLRPGRLKEQVGFKVSALLEARRRRPFAREFLFGDDFEKDALAYSLYSRLLSRDLDGAEAVKVLGEAGVADDDIACIKELRDELPDGLGGVGRALIHLGKHTPPAAFEHFGEIIMPVRDALQMSLALFEHEVIDDRTVREVLEAEKATSIYRRFDLDDVLSDARERRLISEANLTRIGL